MNLQNGGAKRSTRSVEGARGKLARAWRGVEDGALSRETVLQLTTRHMHRAAMRSRRVRRSVSLATHARMGNGRGKSWGWVRGLDRPVVGYRWDRVRGSVAIGGDEDVETRAGMGVVELAWPSMLPFGQEQAHDAMSGDVHSGLVDWIWTMDLDPFSDFVLGCLGRWEGWKGRGR